MVPRGAFIMVLVCGSTVYCREGYKDAESALLHGAYVKEMLEEPMQVLFTLQSLFYSPFLDCWTSRF